MLQANEFLAVREIAGIRFEFGDNGKQIYYTTKVDQLTYDITQNKGESYWYIFAKFKGSVITLNQDKYIPCSIEGEWNLEYALHATALYIKRGANPYSSKRQSSSFRFSLEAQVLQAIRPESFEQDLIILTQIYNAAQVKVFAFQDESFFAWNEHNPLLVGEQTSVELKD